MSTQPDPIPTDPRDVAVDWLARERDGRLPPEDQAAFEAWLARDPQHADLIQRVRDAVDAPARFAAEPELLEMRREALQALKQRSPWSRLAPAAVAASICAVVLGVGVAGLTPDTSPNVTRLERVTAPLGPTLNPNAAIYRTAVGERTSVTLPDGSVAILNTDTVLKVAYTGRERGVRLVKGQAIFDVAKNARVPFQVYAAEQRVTAIGTRFDVRLEGGKVKVALVEGVVRVGRSTIAAPTRPEQLVTMTAGEVLETTPASAITVKADDVVAQTSWESGLIVFKATPLANAVAEINRYTHRRVMLADPSIADVGVTGVFRVGDPDTFAQSVAEILPVEARALPDGSIALRQKKRAEG